MKKIIKFIASAIGFIFLLAIILIILLLTLVHPNNFKDQISQQFYNSTGRHLTLQGDIHWDFFPSLGLAFENADISNASGFGNQPFARIHQATIAVQLLPLFHHKLAVDKLDLDGLELHLQKNVKGLTNWKDLMKKTGDTPTVTLKNNLPKKNHTKLAENEYSNNISSRQLDFQLDAKERTSEVSSNAKSIEFSFNPISNAFAANKESSTTTEKSVTPHQISFNIASINVINSTVTWLDQQKKQNIRLQNIELHSKNIAEKQFFPVSLQTAINATQPNLKGNIAVDGQLKIDLANQNYQIQELKIKSQLQGPTLPNNNLALNLKGDLNVDNNRHTTRGQIQTDHIQIGNFAADQVSLQLATQNNLIVLNPIQAKLYQGKYLGNIRLNFANATPQYSTQAQFSNIQIEPLLRNLADVTHLHLTGVGDLTANLTSKGNNQATIIQNLQGQGNFAINNGYLEGINIPYWINTGLALLQKNSLPTLPGENKTDFGHLTGSFTIKNGVLQNNDLLLNSSQLTAKGAGTANLVKQQLNYQLQAQLLDQNTKQPKGNVIPIEISGSLSHPSVRPAAGSLLKSELKNQYEKNKEKIGEELNKFLGKDTGEKIKNQLENLFH